MDPLIGMSGITQDVMIDLVDAMIKVKATMAHLMMEGRREAITEVRHETDRRRPVHHRPRQVVRVEEVMISWLGANTRGMMLRVRVEGMWVLVDVVEVGLAVRVSESDADHESSSRAR